MKNITSIIITREIICNDAKILRVIDFIGINDDLSYIYTSIQNLIDRNNYEYVDLCCFGIDVDLLNNAGFIQRNDDDLNIIYLYYNYNVKRYLPNKTNSDGEDVRAGRFERKTLLKFTFEEDELIGWEEDKLTLSSAMSKMQEGRKSTSMLSYISLLLNLILIVKVL